MRDQMRDRLDARRFELVFAQAEKGNVGAFRELARMIEANDRMGASARMTEDPEAEEKATPAAMGKKEAARAAAQEAGGEGSLWAGDLTPGYGRAN